MDTMMRVMRLQRFLLNTCVRGIVSLITGPYSRLWYLASSSVSSAMSTSRGLAPRLGPTMPARYIWSIKRPARL